MHVIDVSLSAATTRFNLLSDFSLNQTIVSSLSSDIQKLINLPQIGLAVVNAAVTLQNIRIGGKLMHHAIDDYNYISHQKAIWFAPAQLAAKVFRFVNVDAKCTATIMKCTDPINFSSQNLNIIDYINIEAGFVFLTQCNYDGANTVGEIVLDGIYFTKESKNIGIFKVGSLIDIRSPFNVTITNSQFSLINYISENFDVIVIRDSGDCTPDDAVVQNILFSNNTLTLDNTTQDSFINLKILYSNANKRYKNVVVDNNVFYDIIGAEKSILEVSYYSKGVVTLTNNTFRNCSTVSDFLVVNANDSIVMSQTYFDSNVATLDGYISVGTAKNITIDGLSLINSSRSTDLKPTSLVKLSTATDGSLTLNSLTCYQNTVKVSIIEIDKSVGTLVFQNSTFSDEIVTSSNPYISIMNVYKLLMINISFANMMSDTASAEKPLLLYIKNIEIDKSGDFVIESINISNSSLGFLKIYSVSGADTSVKTVQFHDINFYDSVFYSRNDLISIGPIQTLAQLNFTMINVVFSNLNFVSIANLIRINVQSGVPFTIENCSFINNTGGRIMLEPVSSSTNTNKVNLEVQNITVIENDFSTSTLFVLRTY